MSESDGVTLTTDGVPAERGASLGRDSMWVAGGTAVSRLTGLLRVFALAYAIGQEDLANLFTKANIAPNLVFELVVGGVLSATLVPVFVGARERGDDEATSVALSVGFLTSAALSLLALVATWGYDRIWGAVTTVRDPTIVARHQIIVDLLYLLLPQILFYGIASLCTAYLNAARRYRTAAFAPALTNVVCVAAYIVVGIQLQGQTAVLGAHERRLSVLLWLGLGTTVGIAAMTVPMLAEMRRGGVTIRFRPRWRHEVVRTIGRLSGWTFGYVIANQLALLAVVKWLADQKRYSDAFIFFQLPHGLIAVTLMTTMTPELARASARGDDQGFTDQFGRGLRLLSALIVPAAVGYILLATPITSFLVRGNMSAADAASTARVVAAFAIGLPAFSVYLFACRGFYALSDTRTPFLLNVLENGVNVAAIMVLAARDSATPTSFALAYSFAYVVAAVFALSELERKLRRLKPDLVRPDLSPIARMFAAALVMAGAVALVRQALPADRGTGALVSVVVSVGVGAFAYVGVCVALRVDEVGHAVRLARNRLGR